MPQPISAPTAPHPTLTGYYATAGQKPSFVRGLFDATAGDYDRLEGIMALYTGAWYRRQALLRAGLKPGMKVLDIAVGTGLVARQAITVTGDKHLVTGLDASFNMLRQTQRALAMPLLQARAETLPFDDGQFDFLSMGYALRHLEDLTATFRGFLRVLKPGGTVCILEMTRPRNRLADLGLRFYVRSLMPAIARVLMDSSRTALLWQYFWDTIEVCVPPEQIMSALSAAGFVDVRRHLELGIFSEYSGARRGA